jgi:hypothetical protein
MGLLFSLNLKVYNAYISNDDIQLLSRMKKLKPKFHKNKEYELD